MALHINDEVILSFMPPMEDRPTMIVVGANECDIPQVKFVHEARTYIHKNREGLASLLDVLSKFEIVPGHSGRMALVNGEVQKFTYPDSIRLAFPAKENLRDSDFKGDVFVLENKYRMTAAEFAHSLIYILENTDLKSDDSRLDFMMEFNKERVVQFLHHQFQSYWDK